MSVYKNTPPIVTNGLIWYNDPGSSKGWQYVPGGGTTIILNDFSGNKINLTTSNNTITAYNNYYGGNIDYSNNYATGSSGSAIPVLDNLTQATWNIWFNQTPGDSGVIIGKTDGNVAAGWFLEHTVGTGRLNDGIGFEIVAPTNMRYSISTGSYSVGKFQNITMVWNGSTTVASGSEIYVNGVKKPDGYQLLGTGTRNSDVGYPLITGHMYNATLPGSSSKMGIVMIYNRQLSEAEIIQNYNAHKSRFNLT